MSRKLRRPSHRARHRTNGCADQCCGNRRRCRVSAVRSRAWWAPNVGRQDPPRPYARLDSPWLTLPQTPYDRAWLATAGWVDSAAENYRTPRRAISASSYGTLGGSTGSKEVTGARRLIAAKQTPKALDP